jgi:ribosomal protein L21
MTFVRTLLLASALALPVTATYVATANITAEAAAKKGKKKVKKAKKAKYKHCGTYKYWKGGKCLDARAKK